MLRFNYDILEKKGKRPVLILMKDISGITNKKTRKDLTIPINKKFFLNYLYVIRDNATKATKIVLQKPKNIVATKIIKMYPMESSITKKSNSLFSYLESLFPL